MKARSLVFSWVLFFATGVANGSNDSVFISHVGQFKNLQDNKVKVLAIDVSLPKDFDYTQFPDSLEGLYFLKQSKTPRHLSTFLNKTKYLKSLTLCGNMAELLPEILHLNVRLKKLKISNTKLSRIWHLTDVFSEQKLMEIHLQNVKIDNKCKMYRRIVLSYRITANSVFIESNKKVKPVQIQRVMGVFEPELLFINGDLYRY